MFKTRISVSIDRSREDVFDYVTDPANDVQWQGSCQGSHWASEGPHGVGSTQNLVNRFLGRKIKSTLEVTACRPLPFWKSTGCPHHRPQPTDVRRCCHE